MLTVCEIFSSIQGESTWVGLPCTFVRLAGCNLRCTWCDTSFAWEGGSSREVADIAAEVNDAGLDVVEVTGGEPLLQEDTPALCRDLLASGRVVLVETNGTRDIRELPEGVVRIVDVKPPGSGAGDSFRMENLADLRPPDELKFVLSDRADFVWAREFIRKHPPAKGITTIFTPVWQTLEPSTLAEWILADRLPVRMGFQLQKLLWGDERGR